jgi:GntR family transcriptional regulator
MGGRARVGAGGRGRGHKLLRGARAGGARAADSEVPQQLGVAEGAPVLVFSGVTYLEDGRPIEYFVGIHRGDRSRFETELWRPGAVDTEPARAVHVAS